jgi:hypothetical protein
MEHLCSLGFTVRTGVHFDDQSLILVARKARFEVERGSLTEDFFFLAQFDRLDVVVLRDYSRKCFRYALKNRRIPLPWGWVAIHFAMCFSVAKVRGVDDALASHVRRSEPVWRWRGFEFPVVWDAATKGLYYSEATTEFPDISSRSWDLLRKTALRVLAPVVQQ